MLSNPMSSFDLILPYLSEALKIRKMCKILFLYILTPSSPVFLTNSDQFSPSALWAYFTLLRLNLASLMVLAWNSLISFYIFHLNIVTC